MAISDENEYKKIPNDVFLDSFKNIINSDLKHNANLKLLKLKKAENFFTQLSRKFQNKANFLQKTRNTGKSVRVFNKLENLNRRVLIARIETSNAEKIFQGATKVSNIGSKIVLRADPALQGLQIAVDYNEFVGAKSTAINWYPVAISGGLIIAETLGAPITLPLTLGAGAIGIAYSAAMKDQLKLCHFK